jgi:hypothetical protein
MRTMSIRKSQVLASLLLFLTSAALAKTVQVGTCLPNWQSYSTISQAVSSVPPGSTVLVCPGTYAEQVTITQPLTLRGVQNGNAANPTIIVPEGGLTQSVTAPTNGVTMFFQILVLNTESESVNISDIGVNGSSPSNQGLNGWLEGVYYQNSSGIVRGVATYGQNGNGYGFGIFLEGTTSPAKTITVEHCSVHDFDSEAIRTNGSPTPSLNVNIESNSVISSNTFSGNPVYGGIDLQGSAGSVSNNRVITHPAPQGVSAGVGIAFASNTVVSGNTVENWIVWGLGGSNVIKGNTVSLSSIVAGGSNNLVQHNLLFNGQGISLSCDGTSNNVTYNIINDVGAGITGVNGGDVVTPNSVSNVAVVSSPCD